MARVGRASQRSRCSKYGNRLKTDGLRTETGIGTIVVKATMVRVCSTESAEGASRIPTYTRLCTTIMQQRRFRDDVSNSRLCPEVANFGRGTVPNFIRVHQCSSVVPLGSDFAADTRRLTPMGGPGSEPYLRSSAFIGGSIRFGCGRRGRAVASAVSHVSGLGSETRI